VFFTTSLKGKFDLKYNIKFIISSSSATHLLKYSRESLVGWISEIKILPLNFKEFIKFKGRTELLKPYGGKDIFNIDVDTEKFELTKYQNELVLYFNEYLLSGGYPEYHPAKDIGCYHGSVGHGREVVEKYIAGQDRKS
jgi:predicted AAA+ superfamily ATPase